MRLVWCLGGGNFRASFGPGRYNVFGCVNFGIEAEDGSVHAATPIEWGVYGGNQALLNLTNSNQVYAGRSPTAYNPLAIEA